MTEQSTKGQQISNHVSKRGLNDVLCTLAYERTICSARLSLVETKLALCYQYFKEMNSHYDVDAVIKLQTAQLDLISALFILVEDYLSFSYYLRKDKVQLTNKILEGKTVTWDEHEFLKDLDLNKAHEYLLLPIVDSFQELEEDEKEIVKENLKEFAKDIHERIIRIVKFFSSYNRVYNKYKHISPGLVGTYAILKNKETPHIFVRDRFRNKKTNVMEAATYVLPNTHETLDYYNNLKNDISKVFSSLIEIHIQYIENLEKPFLLTSPYTLSDKNKSRWFEIARKINFFTGSLPPNLTLKINVKEHLVKPMLEALSKDFIYKIDRQLTSCDIKSITNSS